jgi:hypothetical protein
MRDYRELVKRELAEEMRRLAGTLSLHADQQKALGHAAALEDEAVALERRAAGEEARECMQPRPQPVTHDQEQVQQQNAAWSVGAQLPLLFMQLPLLGALREDRRMRRTSCSAIRMSDVALISDQTMIPSMAS